MTEGQGVTAASVPWNGGDAGTAPVPESISIPAAPSVPEVTAISPDSGASAHDREPGAGATAGDDAGTGTGATGRDAGPGTGAAGRGAVTGAGAGSATGQEPEGEPYVRVDARRLESALLGLRSPIVTVPLILEAPGVQEARAERRKLLSQIDDYLLPRLRQSGAPILVALVGSTGAGKSTLMNSLVGMQVSATGIRRPTTNSPVLACHPSDAHWFAENVFLPTLPRVRQQGLAMPGRDGLLVLAASEGMPRGIALLDTPDIDSVVQAHREFAHQFLDASDLWLFMTSARRYADAAVWELLQDGRDRGAALGVVLSRVPPAAASQVTAHFDAMLEANGLTDMERFVIAETVVTDAHLPAEVAAPVRRWLEDTAARDDRRVAVLTQTMSGVLDSFRTRIPVLADQAEMQLTLSAQLREAVDMAYSAALADLDEVSGNGSLLSGEVLARWRDFAGTGDLLRTLQVRKGKMSASRSKKRAIPVRAQALKVALRSSLESLVASIADRAAEDAAAAWQRDPAGAELLAEVARATAAGGANGSGGAQAGMTAGAAAGWPQATPAASRDGIAPMARSSPDLTRRSARAISAWQDHVIHLVQAENVTKRSIARVVTFNDESLALVLTVGVLGYGAGDVTVSEGTGAVPQRLLTSLFGAGLLRDIGARARHDLHDRISLLFAEEMLRFTAIIDSAGVPDETAATRLHEASYSLEAAR
jgi:energy-coupling factor transporter ATP-binding protein EcfA2